MLQPGLVLLDIQLPDLDGFEVAARLASLADPLPSITGPPDQRISVRLALRAAHQWPHGSRGPA